ncbi:cilia- and flagella-associated protein 300 [Caerostris extrusa]|uniref:Cilia- and flagella-associated protein 300 n=1 Tax=Caerostris extrusa TaxID=172846 RepID=A0AAV4VGU5_CAEEX|nr:cilia- and flagella-associated protein 300 [Caerostris extrusa]
MSSLNHCFHHYSGRKAFLQSKAVLNDLGCQTLVSSNIEGGKEISVKIEKVPCSILSTDIFDRIYERGIVLQDGTIRKCFEEYINDIVVADELRNMLLIKESDNYDLYSEERELNFCSRSFNIFVLEIDDIPFFPTHKQHEQDFMYAVLNPLLKEITILHHVW